MRLSICIATYHRADVIGETLASIIPQLRQGTELLVVDGASPDATPRVVKAAFEGRSDCRYVRLDRKGGVDQDYCRAVAEARGEYCWLMTDDDVLKPGAVDRVLAELANGPDLLVVNAEVAGPDLSQLLLPRKLDVRADREFAPGEDAALLAHTGDLLTFIGSVVISRSLWQARNADPYLGTEFVHVGMIFQQPLPRGARVVAEPLVRIRYGRAAWSSRTFEIWMFKWPRIVWGLPLRDEAKAAVTPREPWRHTGRLVNMKAQHSYSLDVYRKWLAPLPMNPLTRLKVASLAALPGPVFAGLLGAVLLVRPRERAMMLYELGRSRSRQG